MTRTFLRDALVELFVGTTPLGCFDLEVNTNVVLFTLINGVSMRRFQKTIVESARTCPMAAGYCVKPDHVILLFTPPHQTFRVYVAPVKLIDDQFKYRHVNKWTTTKPRFV